LLWRNWGHLLGILSIPLQGLLYIAISRISGETAYYNYYWIDTMIPVVTWFAYPYVSWMPILYLGFLYFAFVDRALYWRTVIIYNISIMICNAIFILFNTYVPRPEIEATDWATMLIQFVYTNDAPLNCFPSIHCLTSYLLFIMINRHLNWHMAWRAAASIWLWLIIASTVFIKQHSIIDIAGGIIVAEGVYQLVRIYMNRSAKRKQPVRSYEGHDTVGL